ncbi:hypothetical protein HK096_006453 [Nowakowskiella sp. JEL0078]|nr:hypothetical protein HK096_006453 [Nowakowskiella sp. JEL0078]
MSQKQSASSRKKSSRNKSSSNEASSSSDKPITNTVHLYTDKKEVVKPTTKWEQENLSCPVVFTYSEKSLSFEYLVDPSLFVLNELGSLLKLFLNDIKNTVPYTQSEKFQPTVCVSPTVKGENVTFSMLQRLNGGGAPLVLVRDSENSPLVDELIKRRTNELLSQDVSPPVIEASENSATSVDELLRLQFESAQKDRELLRQELDAAQKDRDAAQKDRDAAQKDRDAAQKDRESFQKNMARLEEIFLRERAKRHALCLRILLDRARDQVCELLEIHIPLPENRRDEIVNALNLSSEDEGAVLLLLESSAIRQGGNYVAHSATIEELAEAVTAFQGSDVRRRHLNALFRALYNRDAADIHYSEVV